MKSIQQPWFETQRIRDDLYCITEPFYTWENRANLWLIKGRDADLLIDTGLGVSSLKLYLADLLDKPLYDTRRQQFFSGDVVYDGELLDELEDSVIDDYLVTMEQLLQLKTDEVRPGHYQSFDRRRLTELVRQYIDTRKAPLCPSEK